MNQNERRCMGCMNPLPDGRVQCGICGCSVDASNDSAYIPAGTTLSQRYLVGNMLGNTGDSAVYIGYDIVLKSTIRIREFFPATLSERVPGGALRIIPGCETAFSVLVEKFRKYARSLARMRELTAIEAVYDIFDANNTAFTVSEYYKGEPLERRLSRSGGRLRWDEARPLFMPLMQAISSLHSAGVYHLGICPQNIIVGADGKLHLQGFCTPEARQVGGDITPDLICGYSAPEQYAFGEDAGESADVYGIAATIFRTVAGNPPPDGSRRAKDSTDLLVPAAAAAELPDYVAAALFQALQIDPKKRPPSVQAFRDKLSTAPAVSALLDDDKPESDDGDAESTVQKKSSRTKVAVLVVVAAVIVLVLFFGIMLIVLFPSLFGRGSESSSEPSPSFSESGSTEESAAVSRTEPTDTLYATSNVVNKNYYEHKDSTLTGGMEMEIKYLVYSNKQKGTIIEQTPSAETPMPFGTKIMVTISAGPAEVTVPTNLSGWPEDHARQLLEALGFRVTVVPVHSTTVLKGFVEEVEQAGKKLARNSEVSIRVSNTEASEPEENETEYNDTPAF